MDDSAVFVPSPTKKRKISEENSNEEGTTATGVVIWDIDDTIVVIQASLKLANEAHQSDLVKCVKDYLFAYLEKEFHFSDTMHMKVVERLSEWDEELINPVECGFAAERRDESLIHQDANDITARGSSYSNFLKSHYRSFQTSETTSCKPHVIDNVESSASIENCCVVENKDPLSSNSAQVYDRLPPGWKGVFDAMESRTFLWTHHARTVLSHLKKKKVRNMIITASEIAPAIAKLIMWGLFEYFDIDDIYSSANKPKTGVFLHLLKDLGNCSNPPQFVGKYRFNPSDFLIVLNLSQNILLSMKFLLSSNNNDVFFSDYFFNPIPIMRQTLE